MDKTTELLEKILAELKKMNARADEQRAAAKEKSNDASLLMKEALKMLGRVGDEHH